MPEAIVSGAAMRIVKLLVGNPPQTINELVEATGVTRTAVTEQLNELLGAGFVERQTLRRPTRGRPHYVYAATSAALLLLFAGNQRLVVPAIWRAVDEIGGPELTKRILRRVSRALAQHYCARITVKEPRARLRRLIELMREEGALLEVADEGGHLVVYKRSCPFISMFDAERVICAVDLEMMGGVVGRPIRRTACRHDGDPCCAFEINSDA